MYSRIGSAAFRKDLTNISLLCSYLGNPHQQFKSIHVGGTNGKGSVSHMLAAIFQKAGYKTGLYTSPHLYDFRERIRVNGKMVSKTFVIDFIEKVKPIIEEIKPSFFEITVAMAFTCFAEKDIDLAVIEVGLGGRLDSTNIIIPELSIITNISLDHTNMLGTNVQEIAFEKAGIIKQSIPVIIGEKKEETKAVFESIASQRKAPLYYAEDHFQVLDVSLQKEHIHASVLNRLQNEKAHYIVDLPGLYQTKNLLTVLQAVELLHKKFNLSDEIIPDSLKSVKKSTGLCGRWEVIHDQPLIVLDVAHNEEGIRQMLLHVQQLSYRNLHIVFGMVKDKDTLHVLQQLPAQAGYYFTKANIPRALAAEELQEQAKQIGIQGNVYRNVNEALQQAIQNSTPEDLIIICGSIFLVAEVDKASLQFMTKE